MSGHSKWATIKRQKGATDAKRGLTFTKSSLAIMLAVKQGGGIADPDQNFKLRLAIEAARNVNMPKDTIERAIQKGLGKAGEGTIEEMLYEGFGPQGIAILVEAATDNKNRTISEVKNTFDKNGGTIGQPGTVSYLFKQIGQIVVSNNQKSTEEIFLDAADAGAEDIEEGQGEVSIYASVGYVSPVRKTLTEKGYTIKEVEVIYKPINLIEITDDTIVQKTFQLLNKLDELEDVQRVYTNFIAQ